MVFYCPQFLRRRRHIRSKLEMRLYVGRGQRASESSSACEIGPAARVVAPRSAIATYRLTSMRRCRTSGTRGDENVSEPVACVQSRSDPSPCPLWAGKTACKRLSRRGRAWPHFTSPRFLRRHHHIRSKLEMRLYVGRGQRARESSSACEIGPAARVVAPRSAIATYRLTSMRQCRRVGHARRRKRE